MSKGSKVIKKEVMAICKPSPLFMGKISSQGMKIKNLTLSGNLQIEYLLIALRDA